MSGLRCSCSWTLLNLVPTTAVVKDVYSSPFYPMINTYSTINIWTVLQPVSSDSYRKGYNHMELFVRGYCCENHYHSCPKTAGDEDHCCKLSPSLSLPPPPPLSYVTGDKMSTDLTISINVNKRNLFKWQQVRVPISNMFSLYIKKGFLLNQKINVL